MNSKSPFKDDGKDHTSENKSEPGDPGRMVHTQFGQASYGNSGGDIHSNRSVKDAQEVLTITRGTDGKPQLWATGDQRQVEQLLNEARQVIAETATA